MKIYLVRHGETGWNSIRKLQGQTDIPLNEYGIELAELTAKGLADVKFDFVFSSPLTRSVQTANIIKRNDDLEIVTDERIKEINFGECEGVQIPGYAEKGINPIWEFEFDTENYIPAKGGETFADVYARSWDFFEKEIIPMEGKYENVLIVGHGCMNRTILNRIMGNALKDFWDIKLDNCAVSIIEVTDGKARVTEPGMKFYEREVIPGEPVDMPGIYG